MAYEVKIGFYVKQILKAWLAPEPYANGIKFHRALNFKQPEGKLHFHIKFNCPQLSLSVIWDLQKYLTTVTRRYQSRKHVCFKSGVLCRDRDGCITSNRIALSPVRLGVVSVCSLTTMYIL
ncbi:hypothetical protein RRG08_058521 [Elysia crispata]|uniref:Uncharacterized protein n=1 Tax=Elysia crispata TaxID=231223 RepID=A0AAE0ZXK0_9GAST|nr:hypothetical protein RRG08_058521 [Elysia crispata]